MRLSGPKIFFESPGDCNLPHHISLLPVIHDIDDFTMAQLLLFTNDINPANDCEAGMISLQGEFYVCLACMTVMVYNQSTRDSHTVFCHKSAIFKKVWIIFTSICYGRHFL